MVSKNNKKIKYSLNYYLSVLSHSQISSSIRKFSSSTMVNSKRATFYIFLSSFLLLAFIILERVFIEDTDEINRSFILYLETFNDNKMQKLLLLISFAGTSIFCLPAILSMFFLCKDKIKIIIFLIFYCFNNWLNDFLKIIYFDSRPFYHYKDIQVIDCECSFGNPSGHAQVGFMFYLFLIDFSLNQKVSDNRILRFAVRALTICICIVMIFIIGISRIYLGVHSFTQVILGWIYSQYILTIYFFIRKPLTIQIQDLSNKKISTQNERQTNMTLIKRFLIILSSYFIFLLLNSLAYHFIKRNREIPLIWLQNIQTKCEKSKYFDQNIFLEAELLNAGFGSLDFGIIFGIIFLKKSIEIKEKKRMKLLTKGKSLSNPMTFLKNLLRILILLFLSLTFVSIIFLIEDKKDENIYILFIFKYNFPFLISGFGLIIVIPLIYLSLGIIKEGDFLENAEKM